MFPLMSEEDKLVEKEMARKKAGKKKRGPYRKSSSAGIYRKKV